MGPLVIVYPEGVFYCRMQPEDVAEVVESHLLSRIVKRLLYQEPLSLERIPSYKDISRFLQKANALRVGQLRPYQSGA